MYPLGVGFLDEQGNLTDANDILLSISGFSREDLSAGKIRLADLIPSDSQILPGETTNRSIAGGTLLPYEMKVSRTDGSQINLKIGFTELENCKNQRLVYFLDKTRHLQAELALQESEQRFHTMADCAPVLIGTSDLEGYGIYFNKQWLAFTGSTLEEERGMGWSRHFHPEDVSRVMEMYRQAIQTCRPFDLEFRLRRYDLEYRWMWAKGAPRFLPSGEFVGFIASCMDVTPQKHIEQEKEQLLAALEQKVEARTRELQETNRRLQEAAEVRQNFVSTLTHDLRTPLIAQNRILSILEDEPAIYEDDKLSCLIEGFIKNNTNLLHMVNKLLETYALEEGRIQILPTTIFLRDLVQECSNDLNELALFKGIRIDNEIAEDLPTLEADSNLLKRLLQNLIGNAIEYASSGCRIRLKAIDACDALEIHVVDNGPGINPAIMDQVFSPYFSKANMPCKRVGSGLGLYICKMIVELHHGTIHINSQSGQGTDICITLPKQHKACIP
jgi:PAS domain S-box-containing protein